MVRIIVNLVEWIKEEHKIFEDLMENVTKTQASEPQARLHLFNQAIRRLDAYGTAEEETLFPAMQQNSLTKAAALKALEWHRSARHILTELIELNPSDQLWLPKMLVARGIIVAHIKVEEETALTALQQAFEPAEIDQINRDFRSLEDSILKRETEGAYKMASKLKY